MLEVRRHDWFALWFESVPIGSGGVVSRSTFFFHRFPLASFPCKSGHHTRSTRSCFMVLRARFPLAVLAAAPLDLERLPWHRQRFDRPNHGSDLPLDHLC